MKSRFEDFQFDHSDQTKVEPGTLLVASPALENTSFRRSVVLVLQNNEEGIFGVVLNRRPNDKVMTAWHQIAGENDSAEKVLQGGPIGGPVFTLHTDRNLAEHEVFQGVYVSKANRDHLEMFDDQKTEYRVVFGLAGWKKGQLQEEVEQGVWLPLAGDQTLVFDDPELLWETSLIEFSRETLKDVLGLSGLPASALDN
ncbi:MAG: YqgE/AlgH family protein [Planctomycetota bacterium]